MAVPGSVEVSAGVVVVGSVAGAVSVAVVSVVEVGSVTGGARRWSSGRLPARSSAPWRRGGVRPCVLDRPGRSAARLPRAGLPASASGSSGRLRRHQRCGRRPHRHADHGLARQPCRPRSPARLRSRYPSPPAAAAAPPTEPATPPRRILQPPRCGPRTSAPARAGASPTGASHSLQQNTTVPLRRACGGTPSPARQTWTRRTLQQPRKRPSRAEPRRTTRTSSPTSLRKHSQQEAFLDVYPLRPRRLCEPLNSLGRSSSRHIIIVRRGFRASLASAGPIRARTSGDFDRGRRRYAIACTISVWVETVDLADARARSAASPAASWTSATIVRGFLAWLDALRKVSSFHSPLRVNVRGTTWPYRHRLPGGRSGAYYGSPVEAVTGP